MALLFWESVDLKTYAHFNWVSHLLTHYMVTSGSLKFALFERNFTHALVAKMDKQMDSFVEEIKVRTEDDNYG